MPARPRSPQRARPILRRARRRCVRPVGQPAPARGVRLAHRELANLRAAFRWAADHDDLETAAAIAVYAAFLGIGSNSTNPSVGRGTHRACAPVEHRRLAQLYVMAAQCYAAGRIDDALGYAEAGRLAITSGRFDQVPSEIEPALGSPYVLKGAPERWVELCRNLITRSSGPRTWTRVCLVFALSIAGAGDEAIAESQGQQDNQYRAIVDV